MAESPSMDRTRVEVSTLQMQGADSAGTHMRPDECLAMVWQLTLDAWAFKEPSIAESRFQRHVVRVVRGRG